MREALTEPRGEESPSSKLTTVYFYFSLLFQKLKPASAQVLPEEQPKLTQLEDGQHLGGLSEPRILSAGISGCKTNMPGCSFFDPFIMSKAVEGQN